MLKSESKAILYCNFAVYNVNEVLIQFFKAQIRNALDIRHLIGDYFIDLDESKFGFQIVSCKQFGYVTLGFRKQTFLYFYYFLMVCMVFLL